MALARHKGTVMSEIQNQQLPHLFFGGKLTPVNSAGFRDPSAPHVIGIYPACKAAAQRTEDNALMRNFIPAAAFSGNPGAR
jgi:hypothetical protein